MLSLVFESISFENTSAINFLSVIPAPYTLARFSAPDLTYLKIILKKKKERKEQIPTNSNRKQNHIFISSH